MDEGYLKGIRKMHQRAWSASIARTVLVIHEDYDLLQQRGRVMVPLGGRHIAGSSGNSGPCLDLLALEPPDKIEECERAEALTTTLWRRPEGLSQGGRVCVQRDSWVAVEDEADIGLLDGVRRDVAIWQDGSYT